jgi:hypothetical protein
MTLYLSNWSSHRTPGMHGPGRKWSIMAKPREWERGDGIVVVGTPDASDLDAVRAGTLTTAKYRARCEARWDRWLAGYGPGILKPWPKQMDGAEVVTVSDGDTLCCACSVAEAREGRCHRSWLAPYLVRAGWRVVLDGADTSDPLRAAAEAHPTVRAAVALLRGQVEHVEASTIAPPDYE